MKLSEHVAVLEQKFEAVTDGWRKHIETELSGSGIQLHHHLIFSNNTHINNHFYPISLIIPNSDIPTEIGLIFPIRKQIFHNLYPDSSELFKLNATSAISALNGLSRGGFNCEYVQYATDYDRVINELMDGKLPRNVEPF